MNTLKWILGSTSLGVILLFGFGNFALQASETYKKQTAKPNKIMQEECGACHMVYPANLLPQKSWNKIMANLENHFEENAEVDKDTNLIIKTYLEKHASDSTMFSRFNNILKKSPKGVPLRITELPYFIRKHDEIPSRLVKGNPKIGSFSQCEKCHTGAEKGDFEEGRVKIPGYGRWDD